MERKYDRTKDDLPEFAFHYRDSKDPLVEDGYVDQIVILHRGEQGYHHLISLPEEVVAEFKEKFELAMEKELLTSTWGSIKDKFPLWTEDLHTVSNAKALNKIAGVSNNQYQAMLCGSIFGFDEPGVVANLYDPRFCGEVNERG
jgi:hypothetical protein|tara:strand:+ start:4049 stop:4480 length:432 start_codon:yes stop_codon:yes gene_type:complete